MAKFQVSMNDDLLKRIDEYASKNYTTRSGAISLACNQMIMTDDLRRSMLTVSLAIKRISELNEIDNKAKEELKSFEVLFNMVAGTFNLLGE